MAADALTYWIAVGSHDADSEDRWVIVFYNEGF